MTISLASTGATKIHGTRAGALLFALLVASCGGGGAKTTNNPIPPVNPPTVGLDARPNNVTCVAPARGAGGAAVDIVDAFPNLPGISQPTKVLVEPVANPRWFVLRKTGQLVVFDPDNATSVSTFLDLSGPPLRTASEGGLLGMAFHPDYPAVPEIFLYYTINGATTEMRSVISRFILDDLQSPGAGTVEQVILEVDQFASNHNGGDIAFGAAGLLYIGLGDGGGGGDPQETGQDTTRLLGSMLRIDVIGTGADYNIPAGNPFAANPNQCGPGLNAANCPEIYAWGLRNPWRWSFDPPTNVLWLGDVGQGAREEIDQIEVGGNYGWDCREGTISHSATLGCVGPVIEPIIDYERSDGRSVTGGFVYRGTAIPGLAGRYVFGDFASGRIWALQDNGQGGYIKEELLDTSTGPSSFGVDRDGELYFTDFNNGRIMKLVPAGGGIDPVPDSLIDSGCTDPNAVTQPYAGLVPYDINARFWSDGADKDRYIGLPNGTTMSINAEDDWVFPAGTVMVKNFRLNGRLIETRHLMRHPDGVWAGYTYEWNDSQTQATRVHGGKIQTIQGQDWVFPDEAQCLQCHTSVAGVALGPETAQLNRDFTYPSTGRTHSQLETLDQIVMFSSPLPGDPSTLPFMPDPTDMSADLGDRARAYLHTNCAQCHQPGGPTPDNLDLRYTTSLADTNACNVAPDAGDLGIPMPFIIAPGDASSSVLVARTNRRDVDGMPPLGSTIVDADGVTLLTDWINGLANCN
ncbi:MAG: PQQ-dependent sugar dehydrogenase [Gammaproteobacteria bacterium]|jgi:uncharacterized repeat protein (TIGR03806 family)|nr:PQQ-dependent sugar dehydrogenase [Gammaproteobacteria bacterium]MDH3750259.1 PQQ-dependent sugar dehydrogenase [Gammaproteobacteria bacterium]